MKTKKVDKKQVFILISKIKRPKELFNAQIPKRKLPFFFYKKSDQGPKLTLKIEKYVSILNLKRIITLCIVLLYQFQKVTY